MTKLISVFIYGTLLPGHSNHHVVSSFVHTYSTGQISGRLVDCGAYPAAVRDALASQRNSIIRGQWITVDRAGLASMDALEEFYGIEEQNDYERVWVTDAQKDNVSGWVYVWGTSRGCLPIEEEYWPDFLARKIL
ncbi:gamma-glutamylcyclotransferase family protein [Paenibacillus sp. FJAT-27812]|uniref:gamma-glutamylcyclotransferase family protein n=1 Tax=Paenibacillus sp. FJAT-27812 TaxID=1684143 RepID=UPI0006A7E3E0|nr:gamma-glutamylcyclotransferase family protein [Paenibacillus sp. FJAT-27812]